MSAPAQTPYLDLTEAEQVAALRPVAVAAAEAFGLDVVRLDLAAHAYNTTFDVGTSDGGRYALRVNTNSASSTAEVQTQQRWQLDIARTTPVRVPVPLAAPDGAWFVQVPSEALGRRVTCTAAGWLDGPDVGEPDEEQAHALGRAMAQLHEQAAAWQVPDGGAMPTFDEPLFGDDDLLAGAPGVDGAAREVLERALTVSGEALARLHRAGPVHALHADLHGSNLKWHQGRLAVFDFDDCGLGTPALDLAVSLFYLRGGDPGAEGALRAGYAEVRPLPDVDPADLEALVAARQLLLANSLLASTTAELRSGSGRYLVVTVDRLRHWLRTGTFSRVVPS